MLKSVDARAFVTAIAGFFLSAVALRLGIAISGNPALDKLWTLWVVFVIAMSGAILALFFVFVGAVIEKEDRGSRAVVLLVVPFVTGLVQGAVIPFLVANRFDLPTVGFLTPFVCVNYVLYLGSIWVGHGDKGVERPVDWDKL